MFRHPAWAIGTYSRGPLAARTEGFHRQNWSPCKSLLGRAGSIPSLPLPSLSLPLIAAWSFISLVSYHYLVARSLVRVLLFFYLRRHFLFTLQRRTTTSREGEGPKERRESTNALTTTMTTRRALFLQATYLIFLGRGCALLHICTPRY